MNDDYPTEVFYFILILYTYIYKRASPKTIKFITLIALLCDQQKSRTLRLPRFGYRLATRYGITVR